MKTFAFVGSAVTPRANSGALPRATLEPGVQGVRPLRLAASAAMGEAEAVAQDSNHHYADRLVRQRRVESGDTTIFRRS
jgi:hypothetical protein